MKARPTRLFSSSRYKRALAFASFPTFLLIKPTIYLPFHNWSIHTNTYKLLTFISPSSHNLLATPFTYTFTLSHLRSTMKFNSIAHMPWSALAVLLFIACLVTAASVPLLTAGSITATRAIHFTIPNKAHFPVASPALYKRQDDHTLEGDEVEGKTEDLQLSRRRMALSYKYIARRLLLADIEEPETADKVANSGDLLKRQFRSRRTGYHDMKRDISSTSILEGEASEDGVVSRSSRSAAESPRTMM